AEELNDLRAGGVETEGVVPEVATLDGSPPPEMGVVVPETIVLRTGRPVLAVFRDEARLDFDDVESEVWRGR
ncbi:MAG TPA: hypothetical protein DD490_19985, partial [Acidobacteria bacterium]|nr:hypothetical protein [Acidobacteriota bacterium]